MNKEFNEIITYKETKIILGNKSFELVKDFIEFSTAVTNKDGSANVKPVLPCIPIIISPVRDTVDNQSIGNLYLLPGYTASLIKTTLTWTFRKVSEPTLMLGAFVLSGKHDKYFRLINKYIYGSYNLSKSSVIVHSIYNGTLRQSILNSINLLKEVINEREYQQHINSIRPEL